MTRSALLWLCLALWLLAMGGSVAALMAEPVDDGFIRGLNRITGFLGWQLAAAVLAFLAWIGSAGLPEGLLLRRLARVPGWWCVVMMVGFALAVAVSALLANIG